MNVHWSRRTQNFLEDIGHIISSITLRKRWIFVRRNLTMPKPTYTSQPNLIKPSLSKPWLRFQAFSVLPVLIFALFNWTNDYNRLGRGLRAHNAFGKWSHRLRFEYPSMGINYPWNTFHICSIYISYMLHIYSIYVPYIIVNYIWNIYGAYMSYIYVPYISHIYSIYNSYMCHIYSIYNHKHTCAIYICFPRFHMFLTF